MSPFHVGMQVVCVDDSDSGWRGGGTIAKGGVYTIRWVGEDDHRVVGRFVGVRLVEFPPSTRNDSYHADLAFFIHRFRPVRKTDISIFQAMLSPKPKLKERV